jgi:transcriptional regulator with XRE-family HTH domain
VVSELGEFLKARRAAVSPSQVGVVSAGTRRVPGLRREEVALLAGISTDYYTRLEQGRERSPSVQVLDALAVSLRLDDDGRRHLFRLAGLTPRQRTRGGDVVDPALLRLMDGWPHNPALVYNRAYDVIAANPMARALFGDFGGAGNLLQLVFTEPRARTFYADWSEVAADAVAGFRMAYGADPDEPRARAVLDGLLAGSEEFRRLWARQDARRKCLSVKTFAHPEVGRLTLKMQTFDVRSSPGQELVVYDAEPGTASADALALLGTLVATR